MERYWEIFILHVQFQQAVPFLRKFPETKHTLYFEMLVRNKLIAILQIYDRTISPILFPNYKDITEQLYRLVWEMAPFSNILLNSICTLFVCNSSVEALELFPELHFWGMGFCSPLQVPVFPVISWEFSMPTRNALIFLLKEVFGLSSNFFNPWVYIFEFIP